MEISIIKKIDEYMNHKLRDVLDYNEKYHVELEIVNDIGRLILSSRDGYSTISSYSLEDLNGIIPLFEERISEYLISKLNIKKITSIFYDQDSIIITFNV